ncbi:hypothetical protein HK100_003669 [Physocladia obscura]|uniref:Uncharacterized protein n=1 Tax=Physocladia obscura TaxID=109957 RepID=A0AAD5STQ6_9FUNG|nr:hypothetical protein HK100_003669 [Physocladia obscura]
MSEGSIGTDGSCESYGQYPPSYTQGTQVCITPGTIITTCGALFTTAGTNLYMLIIQDDGNLGLYFCSSITPYLNGYIFQHSGVALWTDYSITRSPVNTTFTYASDGDISISGGHSWSLGTYGTNGLYCVDSVSGTITLYNAGPASLTNPVWEVTCSTTSCTAAFVLSGYPSTASSPGPAAIIPTVSSDFVSSTSISSSSSSTVTSSIAIAYSSSLFSESKTTMLSTSSGSNSGSTVYSNNSNGTSSATNVAAIVGGVIGAVVVFGILSFSFWFRKNPRSNNINSVPATPEATPLANLGIASKPSASSFSGGSSSQQNTSASYSAQFERSSFKKLQAATEFFDDVNTQQQQPGILSSQNMKLSGLTPERFEALDMTRVYQWGVDEAATWIFRNGGGEVGFAKAKEERITGYSLLTEKIDDMLSVIPTVRFGDKAMLRQALVDLQSSSLPAYS